MQLDIPITVRAFDLIYLIPEAANCLPGSGRPDRFFTGKIPLLSMNTRRVAFENNYQGCIMH
jgi:hypothetical protein